MRSRRPGSAAGAERRGSCGGRGSRCTRGFAYGDAGRDTTGPMQALLPVTSLGWLGLAAAYLLGAIPFGLVLGFLVRGVDVRKTGSGNIGATNVGRALGRPWAFVAFALDFAKGWGPAYGIPRWLPGENSPRSEE